MTQELLEFIKTCIRVDNAHAFYIKGVWKKKRIDIIMRDHYECQECKRNHEIKLLKINSKNKYERAYVHHIKHLKDYPELALDNDNLETLCFDCHELKHFNERHPFQTTKERFCNDERW